MNSVSAREALMIVPDPMVDDTDDEDSAKPAAPDELQRTSARHCHETLRDRSRRACPSLFGSEVRPSPSAFLVKADQTSNASRA